MTDGASRVDIKTPRNERGYPVVKPPYGVWKDGVLWNAQSVGELVATFDESVRTVHDVVTQSFEQNATRPAVGFRQMLDRQFEEGPGGKKFEKLSFANEFTWLTYAEWQQRIRHFGSGLVKTGGLEPTDRVLIYAETQRDWMTACLSCFNHNLTVVTAYATLGAEAAAFAINQTKSKAVVADAKLLKILLTVHSQCPTLKTIITIGEMDEDLKSSLEKEGVTLETFEACVDEGAKNEIPETPPTPDDVAVVMFTSGTTGNPKGVVIAHKCIVAAIAGLDHELAGMVTSEDVYMAYLPLAHIMEMVAEICQIRIGVSLGYGSPHTLTGTSVKLAKGQMGDINVLKPTIVVFAPLVLEKIYNSIQSKVENGSNMSKFLFGKALNSGLSNFEKNKIGAPWLWNTIVFKKIQAITGGNLRVVLTGSAPLDGNVHQFVQTCFNCPVRQGYGATETCAASVIQEVLDNRVKSVGPPRVSCCIKLRDWDEGGYRFSDKDNEEIGRPRGEILIGGELVCLGYLVDENDPDPDIVEKNKTDFEVDENGVRWFCTGDIGDVDEFGCLSIIDRKKDLVKLQQGEYVALSKVEGVLKLSPFVENALVHVSPNESYCTALICPQLPDFMKMCKDQGFGTDAEEMCQHEGATQAVLESCQQVAKGKLHAFEIPKKVTLVAPSRTWTPENDLLTAAMKLKRKPIQTAHAEDIEKMYQ